ncbi:ABC transporter ATP-binding protein [Chelativorans petroleitrophicus]|uniref:ABC transporter ATP-binding protein n=1 Tax=Chelativorans petroleitrophicus TaxID=2975484 RepID=UPI003C2F1526
MHFQLASCVRFVTDPTKSLLEISNLTVTFGAGTGEETTVVDDVNFSVRPGQTLGIVGESGSGKSVTSLAVMGLLPKRTTRIQGSVRFGGTELLEQSEAALRDLRGNRMAMIFQEPMTSLNPAYTIGRQISESLIRHKSLSKAAARARAIELLELVRIPSPERRYDDYPHKLSGGMRQRAMIAIALACEPQLLIADEPTTALDVTVQAQILYLMGRLREKTGAAIVLITHDLGVVAQVCDEVVVMYAGQVVEQAPVRELFAFPQHPYTVGLLGSLPKFGERKTRLPVIQGSMPNPRNRQRGCRFADRCPFRQSRCDEDQPIFRLSDTRTTRCWRAPLEDLAS